VARVYLIHCSGLTAGLRALVIFPFASLLGRHALPVYCVGSILSAIGQILTETPPPSPLFDILFVGMSLKALYEFALLMERKAVREYALA
jgi:hypothetical protein